uniref:Uncharacterized protein AlNc14C170G7983 n=1 Tax=Albugo laibachii Nc14 TaxID=890382 RepID=F0WNF8_9STRA|nr:conserved hypothetical protein [Albugo laibachii Nc14]|eukprot:CCA22849.1 conserved hypothetical protein [Albugo laibachii Nc14]
MKRYFESPDSDDKAGDEARVFIDSLTSCTGKNSKPLSYPLGEEDDGIKKNTLESVKELIEMKLIQRDNLLREESDSAKKHRQDGSHINEHAMLDSEVTSKKYIQEGYRDLLHNENIYMKEVTTRLINNRDDKTLHQYEISDRDRQEIVRKRAKEKMALRMKILAKKGERVKTLKCRERLSNRRNLEIEIQNLVSLMKKVECAAFEVIPATLVDNSLVCQGNFDPEICQERVLVPQIDFSSLVETQSCNNGDMIATDVFNKEFGEMEIIQSRFHDSNRQRCMEKLHARHNQEDTFVRVDVNRSSPLYQRLVEERHRVAFYEEIQFHTRLTRFQTRIQQLTDEISHKLMKQNRMNHKNAPLEEELDAMRSHVCKFERDYFQAHSRVKEIEDSLNLLRTSTKAVAFWISEHQVALQECEALDFISNKEETRLRALERVCNRSEIRLGKMNQYHQYRKITLADVQDKLTKTASECQKLRESVLRNSLHEIGRKVLTTIGLGTIVESREIDGISSVYLPQLEANIHISVEHLLLYELKTTSEEVIAMRAEEDRARTQMLWVAQGELTARDCMQMEDYLSSGMMLSPRYNAANTTMTMKTAFEKESDLNSNSGLDSENVVIRRGSATGNNFKVITAIPSVAHEIEPADGRSRGIRKLRTYQLDSNAERCTREMFLPSIWFPSRSLLMLQRFPPMVCVDDMQLLERLNRLWEGRKKKHSERYDVWRRERITLQEFGLRCQEQQRRLDDITRQRRQQLLMFSEEQNCRRFYKMEKLRMIREQEGMILEESLLRLNLTSKKASTFTNFLLSGKYGHTERIMERRLEIKLEKKERLCLRKLMAQVGQGIDISGRSRGILHTASMELRDQLYDDSSVTIAETDDVDETLQPRDDRRLYLKVAKACLIQKLSQCELNWMRLGEHASNVAISLDYMSEKIEQQRLYRQRGAKKTWELAESVSKRRVRIQDSNLRLAEAQVKLGSAQEINENASVRYDYVLAQNSSMDSAIFHGTTQRYETRQLLQDLHELYFKSLIEFLLSSAIKEHHVRKMMSVNENIKQLCQERNCKAKQMKTLGSKHHRQCLMSLKRSKLPIFKASRRIALSNSFSRWNTYRSQSIRVRAIFDLKYQIILQSGIGQ